jgi:hypothetical protein
VRHLLATPTPSHRPPPSLEVGVLGGFDRPLPTVDAYDSCWRVLWRRWGDEAPLPEQVVQQHCRRLGLPTMASQCVRLAEVAEREHQPYLGYLEARERRAAARRTSTRTSLR